jgi:esterase
MSNRLHAETIGNGPVWVLLHGLFGDGSNWRGFATRLSDRFRFVLPDLCNHGDSPRDAGATLRSMAMDVHELLCRLGLRATGVLGHSMGGKIAMQMASDYPDALDRFIAVDIAPRHYRRDFGPLIRAMRRLDLSAGRRRTDLERDLARGISSPAVCRFLLKSAVRGDDGGWRWTFGLDEIDATYEAVRGAPAMAGECRVPAKFICGQLSNFVRPEDLDLIRRLFPAAAIVAIEGAGHWVHSDAPEAFMAAAVPFMAQVPGAPRARAV